MPAVTLCGMCRHAAAVRRPDGSVRVLRGAHAGAVQPVRHAAVPAPRAAHAARAALPALPVPRAALPPAAAAAAAARLQPLPAAVRSSACAGTIARSTHSTIPSPSAFEPLRTSGVSGTYRASLYWTGARRLR